MATAAYLLWPRPTLYIVQSEAPAPTGRGRQKLGLLSYKLATNLPTWEGGGVHIGVRVSIQNLRHCISKIIHTYPLDGRCDIP
jgi:hypothetical protein